MILVVHVIYKGKCRCQAAIKLEKNLKLYKIAQNGQKTDKLFFWNGRNSADNWIVVRIQCQIVRSIRYVPKNVWASYVD